MSAINDSSPFTPKDWARLAQNKRHGDVESQQATYRSTHRDMDRQYQRLDHFNVQQGQRLMEQLKALTKEIESTADRLRYVGDWGERSGVSLTEWAAMDARCTSLKADFGRMLGNAMSLLDKLNDPVAYVEEFYDRFPQLRPAVPTYLY